MTTPLTLGNLTFDNNLIQGPLAGISCAPFRRLTWQHSKPAFSCTEMISCKTLLHHPLATQKRFTTKALDEGPVCFQLSGADSRELGQATRISTQLGADLIDLNCGCPVNKIRKKGAGSSLLLQPDNLYQLIRAMKDNTHVPVSIKIRVQGFGPDRFHDELIKAINASGLDYLIVHGRHWTEHYETTCHYEDIRFFVEHLNLPVIGNGDIADVASLQTMLATGCAGVMIGRAGVGQPWLIGQLKALLAAETFHTPSQYAIGSMFMEHVSELSALLGSEKFALLQARKIAKYYSRRIPARLEFCAQMNNCEKLEHFETLVRFFFN